MSYLLPDPLGNPFEVAITLEIATERGFYTSNPADQTGQMFNVGGRLDFDDSTFLDVTDMPVVNDDRAGGILIFRKSFRHDYSPPMKKRPANAPVDLFFPTYGNCCRIGGIRNIRDLPSGTIFAMGIIIQPSNQGPRINSPLFFSAAVGDLFSQNLNASDPDGLALFYELIAGPPGLTVDSTGQVEWTPGVLDAGLWTVAVAVLEFPPGEQDGPARRDEPQDIPDDATAYRDLLIEVVETNNQAPTITVTPPGPINVVPGQNVVLSVETDDPDLADNLELLISGAPVGSLFVPDKAGPFTAFAVQAPGVRVSGTWLWTPDANAVNTTHQVLFTVRDDGDPRLISSQRVDINVGNLPPPNALVVDLSKSRRQLSGFYNILPASERPNGPSSAFCAELGFGHRRRLRRLRDLWLEITRRIGREVQPVDNVTPEGILATQDFLSPTVTPVFTDCFDQIGDETTFVFRQNGASLGIALLARLMKTLARRLGAPAPTPAKIALLAEDVENLPAIMQALDILEANATNRAGLKQAFAEASRALRAIVTDPVQLAVFADLINDCLGTNLDDREIARELRLINNPTLYGPLVRQARRYLKSTNGGKAVRVTFRAVRVTGK